jgi:hypothetical protein
VTVVFARILLFRFHVKLSILTFHVIVFKFDLLMIPKHFKESVLAVQVAPHIKLLNYEVDAHDLI